MWCKKNDALNNVQTYNSPTFSRYIRFKCLPKRYLRQRILAYFTFTNLQAMRAASIVTHGDMYKRNNRKDWVSKKDIRISYIFISSMNFASQSVRKAGMRSHSSKSWRSIPKYRKRKPLTLKYNMYEVLFVMEMLSITSPNCKAELRKRLSTEPELLSYHVRIHGGKCIYTTREMMLYQVVLNSLLTNSLLDYTVSRIKPILYFVLFTR